MTPTEILLFTGSFVAFSIIAAFVTAAIMLPKRNKGDDYDGK